MKLAKAIRSILWWWISVIQRVRFSPAESFDIFWEFARRYFFTLAFLSLFSAKLLHLYAHLHSLPTGKLLLWGVTFFFQDVMVLLFSRIFAQKIPWRPVSVLAALIIIPFSLIMSCMAATGISFYVTTGAEIHWLQAKSFQTDAAAIRTLLTGLTGFLIVEGILLTTSWFASHQIHRVTGGILHVWAWPFRWLADHVRPCSRRLYARHRPLPSQERYEQIPVADLEDNKSEDGGSVDLFDSPSDMLPERSGTDTVLRRVIVLGLFCLFLLLRFLRPQHPVYGFLSGSLSLTLLLEGHRVSPVDTSGMPGHYAFLEGQSALCPTPDWDWMPQVPLPGFEDWDRTDRHGVHYLSQADPLHISNLQNPVLDSIREAVEQGSIKIKHVIFMKLESTRADVFPLRKDSFMWNRIAESYSDKKIPDDVQDRLANLTRTAEFLTGFSTGFEHHDNLHPGLKSYGSISARNAFTTGTYTLKSLVGSLCGVTPLVADFNAEYKHHIYQPCLAHVFNAINHQLPDTDDRTDDFTTWPWHSVWMQSVTETYDNQDKLTPLLGYHDKQTKETIEDPDAKHYPVKWKEINYYGYPDTALREYIHDAIDDAERNRTRLFLTHLTGTTHHDWGMPNNTYEQIVGSSWGGHNDELNRYLNTIGFADRWIAEIIGILEEKGVANETLLVMAGDHGLSLPNDGGITPYDNPHIGSFQVPIVLAHPKLPPVEITSPVTNQQIVPTILDLLIESLSLSESGTHAARDILSLYEGQSLIRPLIQEQDGKQDWQFTVMNTGGSWLAVRSAARPAYRLVIPLVNELGWRFTNLEQDPNEIHPIERFSSADLAAILDKEYGKDAVNWLRDAAHVTEWWVLENWRRYGYVPKAKG
ncbi:hypothetical protein MPDQ_005019 [Monascus purpureus]|uniref:Sulfatase N-terminal domain-containing protein n=1 Tax=Monascus purpureus TaxID=5098 RepID=A0A507QIM4_MONPU|nr:hypothetical protein MPDQ_005019 [Monascus purpureus]BDD60412.1 hypothetical protein MAP00_005539 [Monascus purpureus]